MKKLLLVLFIVGITTSVFAELKPKQVVGKWKYTVQTDQGDMTGMLKFEEKEGKLIGKVLSDDGGIFEMTKVELKEGNTLYFEVKPEYDVIKVSVKVEAKKFKGTGATYEGDFALVGVKTE